jgi:hypothetical protein
MSHFATIRTELRNLDTVKAALRRLGLAFREGGAVEDYYHNTRRVDLVVEIPGQRPVGFARDASTGAIALVGDWWGGKLREAEFLASLKGSYAREQVLVSLERQGVDLSKVKEVEEPDGSVVFTVPLDDEELQLLGGA